MSPLQASIRTAARGLGIMLVSLVLGASFAQSARAEGLEAGKTNASATAAAPAAPGGVHISPHARAARERAAAQAEAGQSGIRVSPFTAKRKPHNRAGGR